MTEEKMREALEKANCALREASFFVGSHGFLHAAGQLQAVADDVVATLTKQEAGEVSRSQTADTSSPSDAREEALKFAKQIVALADKAFGPPCEGRPSYRAAYRQFMVLNERAADVVARALLSLVSGKKE
jgi:hypothetical protein